MRSAWNDGAGGSRCRKLPWALLFAGALACDSTGARFGAREAGASGVLGGDAGSDAEMEELDAPAVNIRAGGARSAAGEEPEDAGGAALDADHASPASEDAMLDADAPAEDAATPDEDAPTALPDGGDGDAAGDASSVPVEAAADAAASPSPPKLCAEHCVADQDCWTAEFGFESCAEGRCTSACTSHDACSDKGAQGRTVCTVDSDCDADEVCVVLADGAQRCATSTALAACSAVEWPRTRPGAETGAPVEVCLTSLRCAPQGCVRPCRGRCRGDGVPSSCDAETGLCVCLADVDCAGVPNAPSCDVTSGRCVCRADADCADPHAPSCNAETGSCQCTLDAQCGDRAVCRAGACVQTCDEASTCPQVFDATTVSCE